MDKNTKIICHCSIKFKKGTNKNLIKTVMAAILGTIIIACGGDESFALCIIIILTLNFLAIYSSSVMHWNLIK